MRWFLSLSKVSVALNLADKPHSPKQSKTALLHRQLQAAESALETHKPIHPNRQKPHFCIQNVQAQSVMLMEQQEQEEEEEEEEEEGEKTKETKKQRIAPWEVAFMRLPAILQVVKIRATILFAAESRIRERAVLGSVQRVRFVVNPFP
jgi:CO dehydrogenase/acetyl-CoA synthase beta subunit